MMDQPTNGRPPDAELSVAQQRAALGARLRAARRAAALTQQELAAQVGRRKNWLSDIERGRRGIDPHTLQRLAKITGHSVEYFTNPQYTEERRRALHRPATREDWELLYADDPERASAHASLDAAFERAHRLLESGSSGGTDAG